MTLNFSLHFVLDVERWNEVIYFIEKGMILIKVQDISFEAGREGKLMDSSTFRYHWH
tara:strand:+ start:534 stop:704 length:171 start_codon:yes stop_codon:yes gene_type:complete